MEENHTEILTHSNDSLCMTRAGNIKVSSLAIDKAEIDSPLILIRRNDSATVIIKARKIRLDHELESEKSMSGTFSLKSVEREDSTVLSKAIREESRQIMTGGFPVRLVFSILAVALVCGIVLKYLRR